MRISSVVVACLPAAANAINIVQGNDDGWAEINIRALYDRLTDAGYSAIISAPADNKSGTGSTDAPPTTVGSDGCEFNSCPAGSPPTGNNASMPRFNYVNSYPVTAIRYGIQNLSTGFFGGAPDLAVTGFNVGQNVGLVTQFSGTVGAACEAVKQGVPAIAFSGSSGTQTAWNTSDIEAYVDVYAELSTTVTETLVEAGKPFLPANVWLNVNYSPVSETSCSCPHEFSYVLSRINTAVPLLTPRDVVTCNNGGRLPTETAVINTEGCYASISVGLADTKLDASAEVQAVVLKKLGYILSCLPPS